MSTVAFETSTRWRLTFTRDGKVRLNTVVAWQLVPGPADEPATSPAGGDRS